VAGHTHVGWNPGGRESLKWARMKGC
jgi:hypothetical protein